LGEIMQESAQAAFSFVRAKVFELNIARDIHKNFDIHVHVPEGATPKEGPSAGITLAISILSLLTEIPVSKKVAMSGEITLKGKVLPVGGIKEKLLAAHREGIREAILPLDNKPDLKDLPKVITQHMKIHLVENMEEVLKIVLTKELTQRPKRKKAKPPVPPAVAEGEGESETSKEPLLTH
jgi:ATP-dependent Lon protease